MMQAYPNFSDKFSVLRHDADFMGRMKPGALLRYAQQVAVDQNTALGLTNDYYVTHKIAYLLAKQTLHFFRVPTIDEQLVLTTIPERSRRAVNKRITAVADAEGNTIALVDSAWVLVDTETRRIIRRPDDSLEHFWNETVEQSLPFEMEKAEEMRQMPPQEADYLLCDLNGHINNCCYADLACTAVPLDKLKEMPIVSLSITYHREVPLGEMLNLTCGKTEHGWYTAGMKEDGNLAFEAFCRL